MNFFEFITVESKAKLGLRNEHFWHLLEGELKKSMLILDMMFWSFSIDLKLGLRFSLFFSWWYYNKKI